MTLVQKLITGQPDGTAVTTANTGADMVTPGSDGTLTWKADAGSGGRTGVRVTTGTATQALRFNLAASNAQMQFTGKVTTPPAVYSGDFNLLAIRHTSGVAASLIWASTGKINFNGASGTGGMVANVGVIKPSHQYVVSIETVGASTTSGTATVTFYEVGSTTPVAQQSFTGLNMSANNYAGIDLAARVVPGTAGWQDLQFNDGAGSEIPDYVAPSTPPNAIANNRAAYLIDYSGSTAVYGGTLSYSIAQVSGTTTTASLISTGVWAVPQSATENLVYTVTVTEAGGGSKDVMVTVPQQATTVTSSIRHGDGNGGWT